MTNKKYNWIYHISILSVLLISAYSCEKDNTPLPTGEVSDIDGNVYNTIEIGTQIWMVEDLRVSKYNDGTTIPNITEKSAWQNSSSGAFSWYNNEEKWGALYNWDAVNTGNLAPLGWHIATHADWTTLTEFLGGESVAGGKLKETGGIRWSSPNNEATNESGFTAIPGGFRGSDGIFSSFGGGAYWWSSTEFDGLTSWTRYIFWSEGNIYRDHFDKWAGLSVRCVKD